MTGNILWSTSSSYTINIGGSSLADRAGYSWQINANQQTESIIGTDAFQYSVRMHTSRIRHYLLAAYTSLLTIQRQYSGEEWDITLVTSSLGLIQLLQKLQNTMPHELTPDYDVKQGIYQVLEQLPKVYLIKGEKDL